jgi:hypothetical protein
MTVDEQMVQMTQELQFVIWLGSTKASFLHALCWLWTSEIGFETPGIVPVVQLRRYFKSTLS